MKQDKNIMLTSATQGGHKNPLCAISHKKVFQTPLLQTIRNLENA